MKWIKWIVRILTFAFVAALVLSVSENPEIIGQLLMTAAALYLPWYAFKTFMPKPFVSSVKKGSKKAWKGFWRYVF